MHEAAEHAHAADRFAREIIGFLTFFAVRSRRLMGNPLGAGHRCCTYRKSKYYNHYALEADDDRHDQLLETNLGYKTTQCW